MHLRTRLTITLLIAAAAALAAWGYVYRQALTRQWTCYRVGQAETYEEAQPRLAWFETGPDRQARLRDLVTKWGTGNPQFDRHLAQYVQDARSSEALRERFSLELAWRKPLLPRWAHYWAWRAPLEPEEQVASVVRYLDTITSVRPPRPLTWREILDLQAIFELSGRHELARRLEPSNWLERYQRWRGPAGGSLPHLVRPSSPFPDP
jgi:hypothetical protein